MRAFIIRPFGEKPDRKGNPIDFEVVERDLIAPVLKKLDVDGRTTLDIAKAGNIREDMFRLLVTADLVIADISIHNANVFYELGIRHALRDRHTFMLRCKADDPVFDLQGERYLAYERENPGASFDSLLKAVKETIDATAKDSPVFMLLPELKVQPRSSFLTVPQDFSEDVQRAKTERLAGDLELLSEEACGFEWESEGLRVVGRAQFALKAYEGARITWEALRGVEGDDLEANQLLGTIYQRLGDLTRSDLAVQRALKAKDLRSFDRAELQSLLGRNAKAGWLAEWRTDGLDDNTRRATALRSAFMAQSAQAYEAGFGEDLNHFYSGLNALAMRTIELELAKALPDVWAEQFNDPDEAARELQNRQKRAARLAAAVELSLQAAMRRLERTGTTDIWTAMSEADLRLLTTDRPPFVAAGYRKALAGAESFARDSGRDQLMIYQRLGLLTEKVNAALKEFGPAVEVKKETARPRILLFTGHRIDEPGRKKPRFPVDKEDVARQAIKEAVATELKQPGGVAVGIAGAASGGDILFHEVCAELGVPTQLMLGLPRQEFVVASVAPAGPQWIERFNRIYDRPLERLKQIGDQPNRRELSDSAELPRWLRGKPDYGVWQRNNLWMLHNALALGRQCTTLIALWNGDKGDGPGGTEDMVDKAKLRGAKFVRLDTRNLFGLPND
jgi:Tetratricopeptide Repeats-Sensor